MSIGQLQKCVEDLAKVVSQKDKELKELKKEYDSRLRVINQYLDRLGVLDRKCLKAEELEKIIRQPITCENCEEVIWKVDEDAQCLLIPKSKLELLDAKGKNELERRNGPQSDSLEPKKQVNDQETGRRTGRQINLYSKKICSYCKKTGHTRAKCFKKLSTPINDIN